ncbi:MAG: hypothetical protein EZS28_007421 [Streblomastix strix]|uniref:Uncharacterized protein n=1 Tax=Streblomastix strix TaxID=222440 RepID=A0A5J4WPZ5_9EUKA|nr:MAG: hypothetical protein EZS28_007421 [Streblomastix strix]
MSKCLVEQDQVLEPSDLYNSFNFQNLSINEGKTGYYYGKPGSRYLERGNIFYNSTLRGESKAVRTYYPHKFMQTWKITTDDSFMHGFNSSKRGARTNTQITLQGKITLGIVATSVYPTRQNVQITPKMHYLCDAIIRFTFDDALDLQVFNFEIIGEVGRTSNSSE